MEPNTTGTAATSHTRRELVEIMRKHDKVKLDAQFVHLQTELPYITCDKEAKEQFTAFKNKMKVRWEKANRMYTRFLTQNKNWLDQEYNRVSPSISASSSRRRGREEVSFESSSERSKRSKTKELRDIHPTSVLTYASQMALRTEGNSDAAFVIKEITCTTPKRASKYRSAFQETLKQKDICKSGEEALALMVSAKLSRYQYNEVRSTAPKIFPSYKILQRAKKECYPANIFISETLASVPLQDLLNHTVQRLILTLGDVITIHVDHSDFDKFTLFSKWGFDGSSGHSSYKQAFHGLNASDAAVFMTCLVPLRLCCNNRLIWRNPAPSSTSLCRPIKMEFIKEDTAVSLAEKNRVDEEIHNLASSNTFFLNQMIQVKHSLIFSMIDGKVCNAVTETTSTQKCFICSATSKMFNNIDNMISREVNHLNLGLSVLHGWIRMFECLLHIAYKLPLKKWQARGSADKDVVSQNKLRIQKEFREKCGLIIDTPKPGFGNTNDGNTARKFFQNSDISAQITKLDLDLIKKIHIIMIVVASGHEVDVNKFREFTLATARHYVSLYPWYHMPPTLHKYLIHGADIIASAILPIGELSEEAQEARNKDFKKFREHNSRKSNRSVTNEDIFHSFLISSDPLITSKRKIKRRKKEPIPQEAIALLIPPNIHNFDSDNDEDEAEEEEDNDDLH